MISCMPVIWMIPAMSCLAKFGLFECMFGRLDATLVNTFDIL